VEQICKGGDCGAATRRALVDWRVVAGDRLRIGPTPIVAAARALRLR